MEAAEAAAEAAEEATRQQQQQQEDIVRLPEGRRWSGMGAGAGRSTEIDSADTMSLRPIEVPEDGEVEEDADLQR